MRIPLRKTKSVNIGQLRLEQVKYIVLELMREVEEKIFSCLPGKFLVASWQ
ncbi:hypothetical protein [Nitrosomonas communis]|uniref:hypothetical protein n=1 Tax=Nitrosomonas communis TaxID=44574 RepID=UPI0026EA64B8|nr:hypothetical protein [Nitrosomonas communis]MCO6427023.1 hypothetical protein [Nitrosomonas communis]